MSTDRSARDGESTSLPESFFRNRDRPVPLPRPEELKPEEITHSSPEPMVPRPSARRTPKQRRQSKPLPPLSEHEEPRRQPKRNPLPEVAEPFVVRVGNQILVFPKVELPRPDGPRCVAATPERGRCAQGISDAGATRSSSRSWVLEGSRGLIKALEPDVEDQCFIQQRCSVHLFSTEPDAVAPEWEIFDPSMHSHLIRPHLIYTWAPDGIRKSWEGPAPKDYWEELLDLAGELRQAFEARTHPPYPTALYRYFDADDQLLYIGITGDLAVREVSHIRDSSWMEFAARSTIERYPTRRDALDAERDAIETERPLFNVTHNEGPDTMRRLVEYLVGQGRTDLLAPAVSRG